MQLLGTFGQALFIIGRLFRWDSCCRSRRVVFVLRTSVSLTRWCWRSSLGACIWGFYGFYLLMFPLFYPES